MSAAVWFNIVQAMNLGVPVIVRNIIGNTVVVTDMKTGLVYDTPQVCWLFDKHLLILWIYYWKNTAITHNFSDVLTSTAAFLN